MLSSLRKSEAHLQALERLRCWTRERFGLAAGDAVLVAEIACSMPGCPPLETVFAFWTAPDRCHRFKVFKPAQAVLPEDLPYAWMKDAIRVSDEASWDCC
jgi:hypothetical protein